MASYVSDNWYLKNNSFTTIINGANRLQSFQNDMPLLTFLQSEECKYVYAGSLNKGRQIEELIELFSGRKELLILIGDWGDWLANYNLSSNIIYLGKFDEQHAHFLVSKCDIGLIPYDHSKFYYNICYPTKASFYITAGIPFLSTPLEELSFVLSKYNMVYFIPFNEWKTFMDNLKKTDLHQLKILINQYQELFLWENVIGSGYIQPHD
jgi:hypothetical protein